MCSVLVECSVALFLCVVCLLVKLKAVQQGLKLRQDHETNMQNIRPMAQCSSSTWVYEVCDVHGVQFPHRDVDRCHPAPFSSPSCPPSSPAVWGNSL